VLKEADQEFETILIDGFVHLLKENGKGLGVHLYESLPYSTTIIGVAKNPLKVADQFVTIYRGRSKRALYISAIGCPLEQASRLISGMHGSYRIPTLLKVAHQQSRSR
jgi:deoxyribonuclease V